MCLLFSLHLLLTHRQERMMTCERENSVCILTWSPRYKMNLFKDRLLALEREHSVRCLASWDDILIPSKESENSV